ncbi:protein RoBo-1-like [Peromyscus leucopus]|uniref:protein RoBo-1-like n=1 Tax=Peromyscus leucopus TaxID=10041 RepID=UPI0018856EE3|nr:protein RoBo-1-like [Peromyscus leucopus]
MARSCSLKSLLTVFVFTIFAVGSVESIQCIAHQCTNETCPENPDVCTATKGCFNHIQKFDTPSTDTDQMFKHKGCFEENDACKELEFSATLGAQRRFTYVNRCCTNDTCNQDDITLSPPPAEANGVQCLSYYTEPGMLNIPTLLNCTGNETKCGLVIGTAVGSSNLFPLVMAGMGCATESACNLSVTVFNNTNIHTFCSDEFIVSPTKPSVPDSTGSAGNMGFQPTAISTVPILITLLLLKVLF